MTALSKVRAVRFWDFCVAALVVFPLATGGISLHTSRFKVELSELAIPVLIVTILGIFIHLVLKHPLAEESYFIKKFTALWQLWEKAVLRNPSRTLWLSAAAVGAFYSFVSMARHWAFQSNSYDLGIFTNAIWNLTFRGEYVSSIKDGMNLFADHQSPLFWLMSPLYYYFPKPETLLLFQGFGLATGGVALYQIGRGYGVKPWILAALPLLYWCYLPLRNANAYDFHPEVAMLPLFLWAIAWIQKRAADSHLTDVSANLTVGCLFLALALCAKESASCVAVGIGLAWLLGASPPESRGFTRKLGFVLIFAGFGLFYLETQMIPHLFGAPYAYQASYAYLGGSLQEILLSPFLRPVEFGLQIFGAARFKFLFWTLAPFAFIPLLNLRTLIAALPGYLILFLSGGDHRLNLLFHYSIEPSVGIFWALPVGLQHFSTDSIFKKKLGSRGVAIWLVFWSLAALGRSDFYRLRQAFPTAHTKWLSAELIPAMGPGTLAATGGLVPHLANRAWVQDVPHLKSQRLGSWVDCVVMDLALNQWPLGGEEAQRVRGTLAEMNYAEIYQCGSLHVYERSHPEFLNPNQSQLDLHRCLLKLPACVSS